MGQHTWLLLATICTELLAIRKWSRGMFTEPFPFYVKLGWSVGAFILIVYPTVRVSSHPLLTLQPPMTELDWVLLVRHSLGEEIHPQTTKKEWQTQGPLVGGSDDRTAYNHLTGSKGPIRLTTCVHTCNLR